MSATTIRPTTVKTPATAPVLEKNLRRKRNELRSRRVKENNNKEGPWRCDTYELEDDEFCALGVTVEVTNEVEVIVSTRPPDVVTSWAVVGVKLLVDAAEDDDCVDPVPEIVCVVEEGDVDGLDVVPLSVTVVGPAVGAVVGAAAVVEGDGALATTD